jgi:hypothetical protein
MNQKVQKPKYDEVDPMTAHFFVGLCHSYYGKPEEAKSHFDASLEYFKVRHLKIRMA